MKKNIYKITFIILLLAFITISMELFLGIDKYKPAYDEQGQHIILDRRILYKSKPLCTKDINSFGFRDQEFNKKKSQKHRILFLGDSFILGSFVKSDQTIPNRLEKMLGDDYEVYNMGVLGYGPDQSLLQLMDIGLQFKPDTVILGIYAANDFNDLVKNKLFVLDKDNQIKLNEYNVVTSGIPRSNILYLYQYLLYKYNLYKYDLFSQKRELGTIFHILFGDSYDFSLMRNKLSPESKKKIHLMQGVLKKYKALLLSENIDFLVVILPSIFNIENNAFFTSHGISKKDYFVNEDSIQEICENEKIKMINLYPDFINNRRTTQLYNKVDQHFSIEGCDITARIIYDAFHEKNTDP